MPRARNTGDYGDYPLATGLLRLLQFFWACLLIAELATANCRHLNSDTCTPDWVVVWLQAGGILSLWVFRKYWMAMFSLQTVTYPLRKTESMLLMVLSKLKRTREQPSLAASSPRLDSEHNSAASEPNTHKHTGRAASFSEEPKGSAPSYAATKASDAAQETAKEASDSAEADSMKEICTAPHKASFFSTAVEAVAGQFVYYVFRSAASAVRALNLVRQIVSTVISGAGAFLEQVLCRAVIPFTFASRTATSALKVARRSAIAIGTAAAALTGAVMRLTLCLVRAVTSTALALATHLVITISAAAKASIQQIIRCIFLPATIAYTLARRTVSAITHSAAWLIQASLNCLIHTLTSIVFAGLWLAYLPFWAAWMATRWILRAVAAAVVFPFTRFAASIRMSLSLGVSVFHFLLVAVRVAAQSVINLCTASVQLPFLLARKAAWMTLKLALAPWKLAASVLYWAVRTVVSSVISLLWVGSTQSGSGEGMEPAKGTSY